MRITNVPRRGFFLSAAASTAAVSSLVVGSETPTIRAGLFSEAARELPLSTDADVIVCGAGPAGVTAAITAARLGAKVRLPSKLVSATVAVLRGDTS